MKKFITSFAIAASMLCGTAAAQSVPSTYNYQGVSSVQNQPLTVEFTIMDGDNVVYRETQNVQTNKDGLFTTKVGGNADGWDEIDWTAGKYELHVKAEGHEATCELNAVPYATVAGKYLGQEYIEQDVADLVIANRENKTDIAEMKLSYGNQLENLEMQLGSTFREVFGGEVYNEVTDETTEVVGLRDRVAALEDVTDDIAGIQETLRGKANVEEVAAVENLAQSLSEDLYKEDGIVDHLLAVETTLNGDEENNKGLVAQVAKNENALANAQAVLRATANTLQNHLTESDLTNITNGKKFAGIDEVLANVTSDVQGIQETLRGKANVDEVAAIDNLAQSLSEDLYKEDGIVDQLVTLVDLNLPNVVENLEQMTPVLQKMEQQVEENTETISQLVTTVSEGGELYEQAVGGVHQLTSVVAAMQEDIKANADAIDIVSSDVQGIQESLRGKADVTDVVDLRETVEANKELLDKNVGAVNSTYTQVQQLGNDVAGLKLDIINLNAGKADKTEVDAVAESLNETQGDLQNIVEDYRTTKTDIAELKIDVQGVGELVNKAGEVAYQTAEELQAHLEEYAAVAENLEGLVPVVEDLVENKIDKAEYNNIVENLEGLVPVVEDLVANKIDKAEYNNIVENLEGLVPVVEVLTSDVDALKDTVATKDEIEVLASKSELTNTYHLLEQRISTLTDAVNALNERLTNAGF